MAQRIFLIFLCLLAGSRLKAQCNPNFDDTSSVCGVVQFTNLSTPNNTLVSYSWNFPGGSPATSSLTNPTTTYNANGTYTVCLFMLSSVPACSATICKTITVSCFTSSLCSANFNSLTCTQNGTNATMSFSNTSSGTNTSTVYDWDFGNSTTSTLTSPTGTYSANGAYVVCMSYTTFAPAFCTASICQTITIGCITSPSCSAGFNTVSCSPSGTNAQVSFTNLSSTNSSPISYTWTFGNSATSNAVNPTTTYTANGTYNVCLSIQTGSPPNCTDTLCQVITVSCIPAPSPTCQANFTNTSCSNGQMTFYSISTGTISNPGTTTYTWTSLPNPPPNGSAPYTATICLIMANHNTVSPVNTCSSSVCRTVHIDCAGIGFEEFAIDHASIKIFPNPSDGLFTVDFNQTNLNSSIIDIKVYNLLGELVHRSTKDVYKDEKYKEINLQALANGAYYLRLTSGDNIYSVKLVIAK
jgi:PKD repeat protein